MEFKGAMGGLYRITEWISRIAFSNVLWTLCSSPFLFFIVMKIMLLATNQGGANEQVVLNWGLAIAAPFTVFPATSALFTVVRKWVMGNTDVSTFKTYFQGYKENYRKSMLGGLIYTLLFAVMYLDVTIYMTQMADFKIIGILMLVLMIVLMVSMFNFFSTVVHYQMTFKQVITNSILLTIARPIRVFTTLLAGVVLSYIGLRYPALYFVCIPTLIAMVAFFNFYATYNKLQLQAETKKRQEEEALEAGRSGENEQSEDISEGISPSKETPNEEQPRL
ncbi:putative membrane protein YesL [Paenibacillus forsythiae]|uniref:Membrane protein YesL n=1 Tax=Paenibacillus forsythiae TaxID=365616 RepID=A0ABU3H7X3_9BACL|nr:DUF624 domain-containing protein [Paenibacillus forsythiae]MDT3426925.1 putative membrane protein YesL [Paenibacillus forsythiae]